MPLYVCMYACMHACISLSLSLSISLYVYIYIYIYYIQITTYILYIYMYAAEELARRTAGGFWMFSTGSKRDARQVRARRAWNRGGLTRATFPMPARFSTNTWDSLNKHKYIKKNCWGFTVSLDSGLVFGFPCLRGFA